MADLLNTSLSGLRAFQRALDVIGNNVSNVDTPGYSRQRIDLVSRVPQFQGSGYIGSGVEIGGVQRQFDSVLADRVRSANSTVARLTTFSDFAGRVDGMLSDQSLSLADGLQGFYNALSDLSANPSSVDLRSNYLSAADTLVGRFKTLDSQLSQLGGQIDSGVSGTTVDISRLASGIASLNNQITVAPRTGVAGQPNDLLDQRDHLIDQLSQLVGVHTTAQTDGSVNVYIGSGQALVIGSTANTLKVTRDRYDPQTQQIAINSDGGSVVVTDKLSGGKLGGLLDIRGELVDPTRRELGRLAVGFTAQINRQQHAGMDQTGAIGGDLLSVGLKRPMPASTNTGSAQAAIAVTDPAGLQASRYQLRYDGSAWNLTRIGDQTVVPLSGSGTSADPLVADGLSITLTGTAAAGDSFLLAPLDGAASSLSLATSDPRAVAAAVPIRTAATTANTGTGSIDAGSVTDASNPVLLTPATLQFTGANSFTINGAGSYAYAPGDAIDVNGWQVHISGQPAVGDTFTVGPNRNGQDDNRNLQAMIAGRTSGVLNGGTASIDAAYRSLVARTGASSAGASASLSAQTAIQNDATAAKESVSGVNLDEEAANMLRFQQAYQAAAHAVSVADTMFQSLIAAVRG